MMLSPSCHTHFELAILEHMCYYYKTDVRNVKMEWLGNEYGSIPVRFIGRNPLDKWLVERRTAFPEKSSLVIPNFAWYNAA